MRAGKIVKMDERRTKMGALLKRGEGLSFRRASFLQGASLNVETSYVML